MSDNKDQKPLPKQPEPVVNPTDEPVPQSNEGEGGNEGEDDDDEGGIEVPKKPPPPLP